MSVDLKTFRDGIVDWISLILPDVSVSWLNQEYAQREHPYITLWIRKLGSPYPRDCREATFDENRPAGTEIQVRYYGIRDVHLQVDFYTKARMPPDDALSLGETLADSLQGTNTREYLDARGIHFQHRNSADVTSRLESEARVQRYSVDFVFQVDSEYIESVGYIQTVVVNSDIPEIDPPITQTITLAD